MSSFTSVGNPERRQRGIFIVVLLVAVLIIAQLIRVQIVSGPALAQTAQDRRSVNSTLHAPRGIIYDATGTVLATDYETYTIAINQMQVHEYRKRDPETREVVGWGAAAAAEVLAPILKRDVNELGAEMLGEKGFHILAKGVSPEVRQEILAHRINGIQTERTTKRVYPNGITAGPILGWANSEGLGVAGIEQQFNTLLTGSDGVSQVEIGAAGQVIPTGNRQVQDAVPGCNVTLTLHADLQYFAQQKAAETAKTFGAERVAVVVQSVDGAILAAADSAQLDPGNPGASKPGDQGSWLVSSAYDPGSTGKVLTIASAIEEGVVTPTTVIDNPYQLTVKNGQRFTDHTVHPDQQLTVTGILAESSNTGTVKIGELMSDETRYEYMRAFGWGEPTGVELPGETSGILATPDRWDGRQRYTTMFGQGLTVSLLQNTQVFTTLGNGGVKNPAHIIDSIDCDGEVSKPARKDPLRVVSEETAEQMVAMMESVITDGTGNRASVPGYRVAGKTGTAEIAGPSGQLTDIAASFGGVLPAENPEIAIGVVVYKPSSGIYGGTIAAPLFSDVATFAANVLNIAPSQTSATPYPLAPDN